MIELHAWPTPNGFKISIMLEEVGLPYEVRAVDIGKGDQFDPEFLRISPNNKIPAIVDTEGPGGSTISVFEYRAILIYQTGKLLPSSGPARYPVLEWVMFQMGGIGPMLGQAHHFRHYAPEPIAYAIDRYTNEANRLYGVLDRRLRDREWLAGDYSIADIANMPWLRYPERQGVDIAEYPAVQRWRDAVIARPAVQRGLKLLADRSRSAPIDQKQREVLFGAMQYQRR
jgi:GST-like protein